MSQGINSEGREAAPEMALWGEELGAGLLKERGLGFEKMGWGHG